MFETRALEHSLHKTSFNLIGWQYNTHITLCGSFVKWMDEQSLVCCHLATATVTLSFGESGPYIVDEDVEIVPNTRKKGKCQITTKVFTSLKSIWCFSSTSRCGVSIFVAAVHCSGWKVMLCKDWVSSESGLKALESLEHELPSPVIQIIFISFFSKRFQCFNMTKWFQLLQFKSAKFHMQVPLGGTAPTSVSEPSVSIYQPSRSFISKKTQLSFGSSPLRDDQPVSLTTALPHLYLSHCVVDSSAAKTPVYGVSWEAPGSAQMEELDPGDAHLHAEKHP